MKKQLLLFAFSTLALTSCKDDNLEAYDMEIMKGDWKEVKREIISGKDNKTVLFTETLTGCATKNTLFLRTDYYVNYTAYTGEGANCTPSEKTEGRYTYDADSKVMGIKLGDEVLINYRVDVLSNKELKLAQQSGIFDMDGDKVPDIPYVTYKR